MRRSPVLDALFPVVRQQVLAAMLLDPEKWWYLSELAAQLGTSPSSLQRELAALTHSGLLVHRQQLVSLFSMVGFPGGTLHPARGLRIHEHERQEAFSAA